MVGSAVDPAAVGGADLTWQHRLALDLRFDLQRHQLDRARGRLARAQRMADLAWPTNSGKGIDRHRQRMAHPAAGDSHCPRWAFVDPRSEEHTSELQSLAYL